MKSANYAPIYACVYAQLAEVARSHGYALAVHGSLAADFDLVCIPWVSGVSDPQSVVDEIASLFAIEQVTGFERKEHGRIATTISFSFGECRLDLSFMPQISRSARCSAGVERCMVVSIDGTHEAVRASDYDALAAENERMRAQIAQTAPQPEQDERPTDGMLGAMRRNGLSIDGDNAYKRDLIDTIIGTLMLGKQGSNPPPAGHWCEQFWEMARAEGELQERLAAQGGQ